jgi:catechol 2,3-dioxygenase-like lactoylglutathione lyase family enzyme
VKSEGLVLELGVNDVTASIAFYEGALGLDVVEAIPEDGAPEWAELELGGSRLMLQERRGFEEELPVLAGRSAGLSALVVRVTGAHECEAIEERLRADGIELLSEPRDTDYGTREFAVLDPDGHVVLIASREE